MLGEEIGIQFELLTADNAFIVSDFSCGAEGVDLSDYLCNEALNDNECVTYIFHTDDNRPVAFISLSCTALVHSLGDPIKGVTKYAPAVLIDKFAVDERYQGRNHGDSGFTISQIIFAKAINLIMAIVSSVIGAKYIILFSTERAHHFYQKCCFKDFREYMDKPNNPNISDCIPMYYKL